MIHGTMYKSGQIYISSHEIRRSPEFFPMNCEITIDDREAYVYLSTGDRVFIRGLKGYIKASQKVEIIKKSNNEYSINIINNTPSPQQSKPHNNKSHSIPEHKREENKVEYRAVEVNILNKENSVEEKAVRIFEQYLQNHSDRFAAIVKGGKIISDIRKCRNGYNSVFADYVVYDKIRKENVYFEIKGTSKTDQYWGGVTFKELSSALKNRNNYYFAIICTDSKRIDPFIHSRQIPSDPYGVFMTLNEFIKYSTRASLGIQFVIKYPNGEKGELQMSKNGNNAYKIEDVESILDNEFIQELIFGE